MAKGNYYTPLGKGLWRDERTGAVGTLKVGRGGGFYVDADDQTGTSREKVQKEKVSQAYRDADDKVANFYKRKNKFGELKKSSKEEDVRKAKEVANEKLAEATEFGNIYENPLRALPGEYDINEFNKIDENAKTRMGRFAERNQISENLKKYAEDEYNSKNLFIPDKNVIEDENGNTYVNNDEYGRQLNTKDMKGMGKRYFSDEEKIKGYQRRKGITPTVDDKAIQEDIHSLFVYQNEKNMGAGPDKDPMKRYYDKYGKENVDRAWADMDKKYAVIQGVAMDSEGLRYNTLVEKDKYSPEAIQYYQNATEQAWKNYSGDSKEYNRYVNSAEKEFLEFDSKRSSSEGNRVKDIENKLQDIEWQGERGARNDGHLGYNENYGTLTKEYKELTGKDYEAPFKQGVYKDKEMPDNLRLKDGDITDNDKFYTRKDGTKEYDPYKGTRFEKKYDSMEDVIKDPNSALNKYIKGKEIISQNSSRNYLDRDYEKYKENAQIGAKEGWSDTYFKEVTEYGKQKDKAKDLEKEYPISKSPKGEEYMRTRAPYDDTEYAYATKSKSNGHWIVSDPTKITSNGLSQSHLYNTVEEAREKMEEINQRIRSDTTDTGKDNEGVTYNHYKKERVSQLTVDHRTKEYQGDLGNVVGKHVNRIDTNSLDSKGRADKEFTDKAINETKQQRIEKATNRIEKRATKELQKEYDRIQKDSDYRSLVERYNKTDSRGSISDDSFISDARNKGIKDEDIAKAIYTKHNGPESNNTSDNNIKRLLAKQAKEEAISKGDNDRAQRFAKYEREFENRTKENKTVERFKERKGKVSKKDMSYGDFLEKKFGSRIDRNDLTEDDDDRYYKEYLKYINK